jgi:hypothetical protein
MVFAPKGAKGLSPGFQPWEPSKQMVRPERARDAYTFDLCCGDVRSGAPSGRAAVGRDGVPGVETPGLNPLDPFEVKKHPKFCLT